MSELLSTTIGCGEVASIASARKGVISALLRDNDPAIEKVFNEQLVAISKERGKHFYRIEASGMVVVTDTMTRAKTDRVLPILSQEQVIFSRLIKQTVEAKKPKSIIEAGVGSGFLSLVAAKAAGVDTICDAYDINPRAIFFAVLNAAQNYVTNIRFHLGSFMDVSPEEKVDIVIMNPPYNPTWPGLDTGKIALHASAGRWGQSLNNQWIPKAHSLLSENGVLLNHMMFPCHSRNNIPALKEAVSLFGENSRMVWTDHLHTFPSGKFLERQYANVIANPKYPGCKPWCEVMAREFPELIMVSYALERNSLQPGVFEQGGLNKGIAINWETRQKLHGMIVDSSLSGGVMKS